MVNHHLWPSSQDKQYMFEYFRTFSILSQIDSWIQRFLCLVIEGKIFKKLSTPMNHEQIYIRNYASMIVIRFSL